MIPELLLSQLFLNLLAAAITLYLGLTFYFALRNKKRNKPGIEDLWTAEGYYNYLLAVIKASTDMDELGAAWFMAENTWFTKTFKVPVNRFTRNRYYSKLADAYAKKETELTQIAVELCKN